MSVLHRISKQLAVGLGEAMMNLLGTEGLCGCSLWNAEQASGRATRPLY